MRKLLLTILLMGGFFSLVQAQIFKYKQAPGTVDFGPRIGITTSIVSIDNNPFGNPKVRISLMGGLFARYQLTNRWSLQTDVVYTQRGARFDKSVTFDSNSQIERLALGYVDWEFKAIYNVRYKMFGKPGNFDVFLGAQPSFLVNAQLNDLDVKNNLNSVGFDLIAGSGFTIGRVILYATTKIALTDANKDISNTEVSIRNLLTEWTVAYKF